jgi:V-type H+-transporting ATPase subunit d
MGENRTTNEIQNFFREMKAENIRLNLKKLWLEDFFSYTETLNDTTREMMGELLNMEADFKCVQIVYNSLYNQDVQTQEKQRKLRRQLIPSFGSLYPDCHKALIESDNIDKLKDAV